MEAILKSIKRKKIPIKPKVVISNKPDARGLKIAQKLGVKTEVIQSVRLKDDRWEYDKKIVSILTKYDVTPKNGLICLAGFMRIISHQFIRKYKNRIMNIHPALLPAFTGLHAQKQALMYGAKYSGCTIHFVDDGVDTGPVIIQAVVKVNYNDTEKTLSKRTLVKEHQMYPEAIRLFAEKKIMIEGRRTIIKD